MGRQQLEQTDLEALGPDDWQDDEGLCETCGEPWDQCEHFFENWICGLMPERKNAIGSVLRMPDLPPGWLPHDGGPCPLDPGVWLAVKFRGDADPAKGVLRTHGYSHVFDWHHDGAEDDIIAYKPEEPTHA